MTLTDERTPAEGTKTADPPFIVRSVDMALELARRGFAVIPLHTVGDAGCSCKFGAECFKPGKHPRISRWQKEKADEKTLRSWFRVWRDSNIGIVTGTLSGVVVLDVDVKHDGEATLAGLERLHGSIPETLVTRTGGGGRHLLFEHPGVIVGNTQNSKKLGPGLDFRGDGGFIVAPGSIHQSGNKYEWLNNAPLAPMPEWLLKIMTARPPDVGRETTNVNARARTESNYKGGPIIEGERNEVMFRRVACSLRGKGAGYDEIEAALFRANALCAPPLPGDEVRKIARSAMRYPPGYASRKSGLV